MRAPKSFWLAAAMLSLAAWAQSDGDESAWQDATVATPPTFDVRRVVPLDLPKGLTLTVGIDPETISITPEGVVRYVVVALNGSTATSVMYEGLRCATRSHRVYARYTPEGGWTLQPDSAWRDNSETRGSRHALAFAVGAACKGRTPNDSVRAVVQALKYPRTTGNY